MSNDILEYYKIFSYIDELLIKVKNVNSKNDIFTLIKDPIIGNYFFKKCDDVKWFYLLKRKSYFSPQKLFNSKEIENINEVSAIRYLIKISEKINLDNKLIRELLEIITNATEYYINNKMQLNNFYLWTDFVKILCNIPSEKIPFDIINYIPVWLEEYKFDNRIQSDQILRHLLPKFLESDDKDNWKKVERIIEYVTKVKAQPLSKDRSELLGNRNEAKMVVDSFLLNWFVKNYIREIGKKCDINLIFYLADQLKKVYRIEKPDIFIDFKYNSRDYAFQIEHDQNIAFKLKIIYGEIEKKKKKSKYDGVYYHSNPELKSETKNEFTLVDIKSKEGFYKRLKNYLKEKDPDFYQCFSDIDEYRNLYMYLYNDNSSIKIESLFDIWVSTRYEPEEILIMNLCRISSEIFKNKKDNFNLIFNKLNSDIYAYPVFKRILLYIIGDNWELYKNKFWEWIDQENDRLFDDSSYEKEVYHILKNNIKDCQNKKDLLKKIIEAGPQLYLPKNEKEEKVEKYINYWKQKWYSALKEDENFNKRYEELKNQTKLDEEKELKRSKGRSGPGSSPLKLNEILSKSNNELADIFKNFVTVDFIDGPSVDGFSEMVKVGAQEHPEKFIDNLDPFKTSYYIYIYYMLWGFREACIQKKIFNWEKLLKFISVYISPDDFWNNEYAHLYEDRADYQWVIGNTGWLIQEGIKDENYPIPTESLSQVKELLLEITDRMLKKIPSITESNDMSMHALNSSYGKIIRALIYLTVKIARDTKDEKVSIKWDEDVKDKIELLLTEKNPEMYYLLGEYLPNFKYIDKIWVNKKIKEFLMLNKKNEFLWESFMEGYLFISMHYIDLYNLLNDHYKLAIKHNFKNEHTNKKLVQHICISYLHEKESLTSETLFGLLLKQWTPEQIIEVISFFWMQRDYILADIVKEKAEERWQRQNMMKKQILIFWKWVFERYRKKKKLNKTDIKILSHLGKLAVYLPEIDKVNAEWLKLSAWFDMQDFNSPFFIEYLNKIKTNGSPKPVAQYLGKIYLKLLEDGSPIYKEEDITDIVEFLYENDNKKDADLICNIYGSQGYDFLRSLYEKYQEE